MSPRPTLLVVLIAVLASLASAASASAATRTFTGASERGSGVVTFQLKRVAESSVRSGFVQIAGKRTALSGRQLRTAARQGVLRMRPRARGAMAARATTPRLILNLGAARPVRPVPAQAFYVAPNGSDSAQGTAAQPWRTIDHAVETVPERATIVLGPGAYGARGHITHLDKSGITVVGAPGAPKPSIRGQARLDAPNVTASGLLFDGPTGGVAERTEDNPTGEDVQVWVRSSGARIENSRVRNNAWHAGVYVSDDARNVQIMHNRIDHNGTARHPNLDHGIYWDSGSGVIEDNIIEANQAWGVHLYPETAGVIVRSNVIRGHGKGGVIIAENARNNRVDANTVTGNTVGIRGYALRGTGNTVSNNTVNGNREGNLIETQGLALSNNRSF